MDKKQYIVLLDTPHEMLHRLYNVLSIEMVDPQYADHGPIRLRLVPAPDRGSGVFTIATRLSEHHLHHYLRQWLTRISRGVSFRYQVQKVLAAGRIGGGGDEPDGKA